MPNIGVNKTTGEESPPLLLVANSRRVKYKVVDDLMITEASDWNKGGDNYDDKCNR